MLNATHSPLKEGKRGLYHSRRSHITEAKKSRLGEHVTTLLNCSGEGGGDQQPRNARRVALGEERE
jgi:hypothetical protein